MSTDSIEQIHTFAANFIREGGLNAISGKALSVETLMHAQHLLATALYQRCNNEVFRKVANSLCQHENATVFLETLGIEQESYCLEAGMTHDEVLDMKSQRLTADWLLDGREYILVRPILNAITPKTLH